jgi:hypothetical protein
MNEQDAYKLCLKLMKADSEEEVISILDKAEYWGNPKVWRFYGDNENNYSTIGNQQSRPDAALVEKLVNSIDARLLNDCLARGIDPESEKAPRSIQQAIAEFVENTRKFKDDFSGKISNWEASKRTEIARNITLAATGFKPSEGKPSFSIADNGEGQTPDMMPLTFLSLSRSNKLRIPFVQGKFNMGGSGVLRFCGRNNLQLILTRRNPVLIRKGNADSKWGFTIVRRNDPEEGRRNSIYKYLAPLDSQIKNVEKGVLRFSVDQMPIFPEGRDPYKRISKWGTLIKLYEYDITGYKTHILRRDGILSRLELLMPEAALPIRLHECRSGYHGHEGSFETTLTGLGVRLEDDKATNIEDGFPSSCPIRILGEQITAKIFVFKKGRAESYRKSEGIVFVLNGQTHAHLTTDFFTRKNVGLSYLADSLLVILDCSSFSVRAREDLFINSRDRLSRGELHDSINESLEHMLKEHEGLRSLKEKRRREEIESRLEDSKPLEDVLETLLKNSPVLSQLFLLGKRITNPFKTADVQSTDQPYIGKKFPTYFRFKGKNYGEKLIRQCPINKRCRIIFETDAENDYFGRNTDKGSFTLFQISGNKELTVGGYILNLQNGRATLTVQLPSDCCEGHRLHYVAIINDIGRLEPFENHFSLEVIHEVEQKGGGVTKPGKPPSKNKGNDESAPTGIQLPNIVEVYEASDDGKRTWRDLTPPFDKYSALRIRYAGNGDIDNQQIKGPDVYDFFINIDNAYARMELKSGKLEPEVARARFIYGMVLIGLGLLQQDAQNKKDNMRGSQEDIDENVDSDGIERKVEEFSKAVAPILLPMIDGLGALDLEATKISPASGETD